MKTKLVSFIAVFTLFVTPFSCDDYVSNKPASTVELNKKTAEIIEADQQFAFELFSEACALALEDNLMISPLSVAYALGMTYNGAAGTTLDAFNAVLHFSDLTSAEVNESYKSLMDQIVTLDEKVEFQIANSIWCLEGARLKDDFIHLNKDYFDAIIEELDFSDPAAVDVINDWIAGKTNDKIRDMLDFIPPTTYMYLINAIYFNAVWKYEFDEDDTYEGDFYLEDGAVHKTDFMTLQGDFAYAQFDNFTAVELPYGDSAFSMVVMVPAYGYDLDVLLEDLSLETWNKWYETSSPQATRVILPKFKYDFKSLLNDHLINLGLGIAFENGADFSGMTDEQALFISRVIHQSFIDVNEKGTEAAAATIVEMRWKSDSTRLLNADKPFIYIIKENSTGAILFMGKVGRPEY